MTKIFKNRKGQNTVEYIILLAVIVGIVLVVWNVLQPYLQKNLPDVMIKTFNVCAPDHFS
jgi:uncharacterized protein (UPF0333 family)